MRSTSTTILLAFAPALVQGGGLFQPAYAPNYAPKPGQVGNLPKQGFQVRVPQPSSNQGFQVSQGGLSPEQLAFMQRKAQETGQSFSAAPASAPVAAGGYSPEQLEFMRRKGSSPVVYSSGKIYGNRKSGYTPKYAPAYAHLTLSRNWMPSRHLLEATSLRRCSASLQALESLSTLSSFAAAAPLQSGSRF